MLCPWGRTQRSEALRRRPRPRSGGMASGVCGEGAGPLIPRPSPKPSVPRPAIGSAGGGRGWCPGPYGRFWPSGSNSRPGPRKWRRKRRCRTRSARTALKWMLVTCFGYLGYKNARFGRIEAHEAVTAYGRDKLLTAKEIFEAAGFTVLHGLTDCLWVQKPGIVGRPRPIRWQSTVCRGEIVPRPPGSSWPWRGCTAGFISWPPNRTRSGRWPPATSGSLRTAR